MAKLISGIIQIENATVKIVGKSLMKLNNTDTRTMANDNCLSICLLLDFE